MDGYDRDLDKAILFYEKGILRHCKESTYKAARVYQEKYELSIPVDRKLLIRSCDLFIEAARLRHPDAIYCLESMKDNIPSYLLIKIGDMLSTVSAN